MVLIVNPSRRKAIQITDIFHYMMILSYPCTPKEALTEISTKYHAVLIVDPEDIPDAIDFIARLRSMSLAPIFALSSDPKWCPSAKMLDKVYTQSILSSDIVKSMIEYCVKNEKQPIGQYSLAGIDCSPVLKMPTYYFEDIKLSKTERMILSYLIVTYPIKQSNADIVEYSYKAGKKPLPDSVRAHISHINKKIRDISGHDMIGNIPCEGYYLLTPEIARNEETVI